MKRTVICFAIFVLASGMLVSQSINLKIGVFVPQLDSDLWRINMENLTLAKSDLVNVVYGGEYEGYLNRNLSFTLEIGGYSKTIYAQYRDYEREDGSPIFQNVSLRIVPVEAGVKFYPAGHRGRLNPFVGLGGGLYVWTYQQFGEFINFQDMSVSEGFAETRRFALGLHARAGLVYRFQSRLGVSLEGKYQYLKGRLSENFEDFEPLDMSGFAVNAGIQFFFR